MKYTDYLAPAAVLAAMLHLAVRPTWVSAAALLIAVAFFAAERLTLATRRLADAQTKYGAEVEAMRVELKHVSDAVKMSEAKATMQKRSVF